MTTRWPCIVITVLCSLLAIATSECTCGIKLRNPQMGQTATCGPYHVTPGVGEA